MQTHRRGLLFGLTAVGGFGLASGVLGQELTQTAVTALAPRRVTPNAALASARRLKLHNLHTGDTFGDVYFENGAYVPAAMAQAQRVLRDWRNGEEHFMDPKLFDLLHNISDRLETGSPFQIISGYRSPRTNAALHERSSGVASNSQHMYGKAVDVRMQGVALENLHKAALSLKAGGVGVYPVSNWVHVDTARVRTWQGV